MTTQSLSALTMLLYRHTKRREFIMLLGGAAAASPLAARAQQGERMSRIGVLMATTTDDSTATARVIGFVQGLEQFGWTEGRNARIDIRWAAGEAGRFRQYATELVALAPQVILANSSQSVAALLQATRTVPIVFAGIADPVGAGFVETLARPGGNATGFMLYEYGISGKWLELLKEIAPRVKRVGFLQNLVVTTGLAGEFGAMQADGTRQRRRTRAREYPFANFVEISNCARHKSGEAPPHNRTCI